MASSVREDRIDHVTVLIAKLFSHVEQDTLAHVFYVDPIKRDMEMGCFLFGRVKIRVFSK